MVWKKSFFDGVTVDFFQGTEILKRMQFAAQRIGIPVIQVGQLDDQLRDLMAHVLMQGRDGIQLIANLVMRPIEAWHMPTA